MHRMQALGSAWYQERRSLVLRVPSIQVQEEYDYVINTLHLDFGQLPPIVTTTFSWDHRLV